MTDLLSIRLRSKDIQTPKQLKMWFNAEKSLAKVHEDNNVKNRLRGSNDGSGFYNNIADPEENPSLEVQYRTPQKR